MKTTSLKTRIVAVILTLVTMLSIMSVSICNASAASSDLAATSYQVDGGTVAKKVAGKSIEKIIEVASDFNPVTKVLGAAGIGLFDSLFNGGDTEQTIDTQQILDSISDVSHKMDTYHEEEMNAINTISDKLAVMDSNFKLNSFKETCNDIRSSDESIIDALNSYGKNISPNMNGSTKVIDAATYNAYQKILSKYPSDSEMTKRIIEMKNFLTGNNESCHQKCYNLMIDAYKQNYDLKAFSNTDNAVNAPDLGGVKNYMDGIEADIAIYYTAYLTKVQMEYQCDNYESYMHDHTYVDISGYASDMNKITEKFIQINDRYDEASDYFDGMIAATLSYRTDSGSVVTRYYPSSAKAWTYATQTQFCEGTSDLTMTLCKDWIADKDTGLRNGLAIPPYKALSELSIIQSNGMELTYIPYSSYDITLNLNGHNIDVSAIPAKQVDLICLWDHYGDGQVIIADSQGGGNVIGETEGIIVVTHQAL